jgi:hypothetical protein
MTTTPRSTSGWTRPSPPGGTGAPKPSPPPGPGAGTARRLELPTGEPAVYDHVVFHAGTVRPMTLVEREVFDSTVARWREHPDDMTTALQAATDWFDQLKQAALAVARQIANVWARVVQAIAPLRPYLRRVSRPYRRAERRRLQRLLREQARTRKAQRR